MSSRLSADDSRPSPARRRRRLFAIGAGLFLPIVLIWLGAAFIVARGLQFPPALPYSTSGTAADAGLSAKSNVPLRELIRGPSTEITLEQNRAPLHALIAPAGQSPAVVLVYPNRVNSQNLVSYYNLIRAAGYRALIIDYDDPGARFGFGWKQRAGVAAAVAAL